MGVVLVVAITAVMAIIMFIAVVYRDRFKPQGRCVVRPVAAI